MYQATAFAKVRTSEASKHSKFMLSKGGKLDFALKEIHLRSSWKLSDVTLTGLMGIVNRRHSRTGQKDGTRREQTYYCHRARLDST